MPPRDSPASEPQGSPSGGAAQGATASHGSLRALLVPGSEQEVAQDRRVR